MGETLNQSLVNKHFVLIGQQGQAVQLIIFEVKNGNLEASLVIGKQEGWISLTYVIQKKMLLCGLFQNTKEVLSMCACVCVGFFNYPCFP